VLIICLGVTKYLKILKTDLLSGDIMSKKDMNTLDWISYVLLVVGGLNWGLVGIGNFMGMNLDLVNLIFGAIPVLRDIVYIVVGLGALYAIYHLMATKK
jgi:uncharacterized membrane protein YuzA (DUF378 family)